MSEREPRERSAQGYNEIFARENSNTRNGNGNDKAGMTMIAKEGGKPTKTINRNIPNVVLLLARLHVCAGLYLASSFFYTATLCSSDIKDL